MTSKPAIYHVYQTMTGALDAIAATDPNAIKTLEANASSLINVSFKASAPNDAIDMAKNDPEFLNMVYESLLDQTEAIKMSYNMGMMQDDERNQLEETVAHQMSTIKDMFEKAPEKEFFVHRTMTHAISATSNTSTAEQAKKNSQVVCIKAKTSNDAIENAKNSEMAIVKLGITNDERGIDNTKHVTINGQHVRPYGMTL